MADPVTTLILGGSAALKAVGAIQQGNTQQANWRNQAAVNEYNAQLAEQNAAIAYDTANSQEEQRRRMGRMVLGASNAARAQSGVDAGSGSALLEAHQEEAHAELDALMVRHQGELQATAYQEQATGFRAGAAVDRQNARSARTAMYWNIAGVGVQTAANAYSIRPTTLPGGSNLGGGGGGSW